MVGERRNEISDDVPPHSRLFIVFGRQKAGEEEFRAAFSEFGPIEDIYFPRNRNTGEGNGIVYIKYSKTSHAAQALEAMNQQTLPGCQRPLKVMVAANRSGIKGDYDHETFKRLFITIPTIATEEDVRDYFKQFGTITSVTIQRDRMTMANRGFAYVSFAEFSTAAIAFEEADNKYRAIFASPRADKRSRTVFETNMNALATPSDGSGMLSMMNVQPEGYTRICALCSPFISKHHIESLFDLIPGMLHCQYAQDLLRNSPKVFVTYSNPMSAAYAVRKLHNFEYPPGERILVKPEYSNTYDRKTVRDEVPNAINTLRTAMNAASSSTPDLKQLVDAIAKASSLIKAATTGATEKEITIDSADLSYCSVPLPPSKPLSDINSTIVKRCFLVCQPQPPPQSVLRDIFCRFGDLINVYTIPNKTVGYACYASVEAADEAIRVLHGAEICGIRTKVLEAEERRDFNSKRMRVDE